MDRLPAFLVAMSRSSHDVATILALAASAAATVLDMPSAIMVREGPVLRVAAVEAPETAPGAGQALTAALERAGRLGSGLLVDSMVDGRWHVANLDAPSSGWSGPLRDAGLGWVAVTPLLAGEHVLGLLVTARPARPAEPDRAVAAQSQLAGHVATFLDTAKALTQMRQSTMVVDAMPDAIVGFSRERDVILWNAGAARMYGISEEEALGQPLDVLVPTEYGPPGRGGQHGPAISLINQGQWSGRVRQRTRTGQTLDVDVSIASIIENGVLQGAVAINRDVSGLLEAERRRAEHERRLQALLDASHALTAVFDAQGRITAVNTAWAAMVGTGAALVAPLGVGADYLGALSQSAQDSPDAARLLAGVRGVLDGTLADFELDYDAPGAQETLASYAVHVAPMPGGEGGAFTTHTDISARKAMERQLAHQATHDSLTGLLTRRGIELELAGLLTAGDDRVGAWTGVVIVDLDRFKDVNDTLGHPAGDLVLQAMAQRLRGFSPARFLARLSGDEFGLVLAGIADRAELARMAGDVQRIVGAPLVISEREMFFGSTVGTALAPDTRGGPDAAADLIRAADTALYRAKERGRNSVVAFDDGLRADVERRVRLASWLARALENDQIRVNYQPQFRCLDGRPIGVEALVRWHHPEAGDVSPAEFITIAEESGSIVAIGSAVLLEACTQACAWVARAGPDFTVAVNLSPLQLISPELLDTVESTLRRTRLPASCLTLEVTEGALIEDPAAASQALARLRGLGVRISVDDFGTGYSSLAYLARFPVDELKVDRMFVRDLERDAKARALVEGIVRIGHALSMRIVAEGVETPGQLRFLTGAGADCYQGFLSARAEPAHVITRRLAQDPLADLTPQQSRDAGRIWQ